MSERAFWAVLIFLFALNSGRAQAFEIRRDETVVFFPALAQRVTGEDAWECEIQGVIFEAEKRRVPLSILRRTLSLNGYSLSADEKAIFNERTRLFMVDNEGGKNICIKLGDTVFPVEKSGANGHFSGKLKLKSAQVEQLQRTSGPHFHAVLPAGDERTFSGNIIFIAEQGISIISDVDDTIKISQVRDRKQLVANTFYRPFKPVSGMAGLYQQWSKIPGTTVHYVSASPWQLYEPIHEFTRTNGFPDGSFHMKQLRLQDGTFLKLFEAPDQYKIEVIQPLLKAYPKRRFVLVGDSGEKDPEAYGTLARRYPEAISRIYIRDVTGETRDSTRYREAFKGLPESLWQVFKELDEIRTTHGVVGTKTGVIRVGMPFEQADTLLKASGARQIQFQVMLTKEAALEGRGFQFYKLANGAVLDVTTKSSNAGRIVSAMRLSTYEPKSNNSKIDPERIKFEESFEHIETLNVVW